MLLPLSLDLLELLSNYQRVWPDSMRNGGPKQCHDQNWFQGEDSALLESSLPAPRQAERIWVPLSLLGMP